MIETLYKTETPEKGRSECYTLILTARPASDNRAYVFMEEHGHWNEEVDRFTHEVKTVNTDDKLTHEEAFAMFDAAKKNLAERGFIHAFVPEHSRRMLHGHQTCELEAVSA